MATTSTAVTLVRHGRTPWHEGNRYTGVTDIGIDEVGEQQAMALAAWAGAARPDVLYASPMLRARQTAQPVADVLDVPVHADHRLRELDFGEAEGHTLEELRRASPGVVELFERDPVAHHLPGGEHPERAVERATGALSELVARHGGQDVLVVCHNTLIRLVVCHYLGVPLSRYRTALRGMEPTAMARVTFRRDGMVTVEYYNRTPYGQTVQASQEGAGRGRVC